MSFTNSQKHSAEEIRLCIKFLNEIFSGMNRDDEDWFFSITNDPKIWAKHGQPLQKVLSSSSLNTYHLSPSTFDKSGDGRRTEANFKACYALVMDDVGTGEGSKASQCGLKPTAVIETSKGNTQEWFAFDHPVKDYNKMSAILGGAHLKGLCDKGGNAPCRLVKLPLGVNLKEGRNNWPVRVLEINEGVKYSYDFLVKELGLELGFIKKDIVVKGKYVCVEGARDILWDELVEKGLTESNVSSTGFVKVTCPRAYEHSDPAETTAGYSPLGYGDNPAERGFNCFHSHEGEGNLGKPDIVEFLEFCASRLGCSEVSRIDPDHMIKGWLSPIPWELFPTSVETKDGGIKVLPTIENYIFMSEWYGIEVRNNVITKEVTFQYAMDSHCVEEVGDINSFIKTLKSQCHRCNVRIDSAVIEETARQLVNDAIKVNPCVDYYKSLSTEGCKGGIERMFNLITLTDETQRKYLLSLFRTFMINVVACHDYNEHSPIEGTQRSYELIATLIGDQGTGKTRFWKYLPPEPLRKYFIGGCSFDPSDKDSVLRVVEKAFVELGEVETTTSKSSARFKAFISEDKTVVRRPYAPFAQTYEMRTVFLATTNDREFLKDPTGNRRWVCFNIKSIVGVIDDKHSNSSFAEGDAFDDLTEENAGFLHYVREQKNITIQERNKISDEAFAEAWLMYTNGAQNWLSTKQAAYVEQENAKLTETSDVTSQFAETFNFHVGTDFNKILKMAKVDQGLVKMEFIQRALGYDRTMPGGKARTRDIKHYVAGCVGPKRDEFIQQISNVWYVRIVYTPEIKSLMKTM